MKRVLVPLLLLVVVANVGLAQRAADMATLLDTAAATTGVEYVKARDRIVAIGQDAVPQLDAIKTRPDIPWQRRVMARICLERIQRSEELQGLLSYQWRTDPRFKDHPGWQDRLGFPYEAMTKARQQLFESRLLGYCYELMWKKVPQRPSVGQTWEWERAGVGILLEQKDPDLVYWAREEIRNADPYSFDHSPAYRCLVQLKDNDSLPFLFDLWLNSRVRHYEGMFRIYLGKGETAHTARHEATEFSTRVLADLLPLATRSDAAWILPKLRGISLGDAAKKALRNYIENTQSASPPAVGR